MPAFMRHDTLANGIYYPKRLHRFLDSATWTGQDPKGEPCDKQPIGRADCCLFLLVVSCWVCWWHYFGWKERFQQYPPRNQPWNHHRRIYRCRHPLLSFSEAPKSIQTTICGNFHRRRSNETAATAKVVNQSRAFSFWPTGVITSGRIGGNRHQRFALNALAFPKKSLLCKRHVHWTWLWWQCLP